MAFSHTRPDFKLPKPKWQGGQPVTNEVHGGERSLLLFDDRKDANVEAVYEPHVAIPEGGLRLRFWYRTAVPGQSFLVTLNCYDATDQWISGGNIDISLQGNGRWQEFDRVLRKFPERAKSVQLHLRPASWSERGELCVPCQSIERGISIRVSYRRDQPGSLAG